MALINKYTDEIFNENSLYFSLKQLEGGLCGGVQLLKIKSSGNCYIIKMMGRENDPGEVQRFNNLKHHLNGIEDHFSSMAKLYHSFIYNGTIHAVYQYLSNTEKRHPSIDEILQVSSESFRASKQYNHKKVQSETAFENTVLSEIEENGIDRYSKKYFSAFVNETTGRVIPWMKSWAEYFIKNRDFKKLYMQCTGFIHRDIHRDNIMISGGIPHLIDYDYSEVDCRLFDLTRPLVIYIEPENFLETYLKMKKDIKSHLSPVESEIIDRITVLDILACSGWEASEIQKINDKRVKSEFRKLLHDRIHYLDILIRNIDMFNLKQVPCPR